MPFHDPPAAAPEPPPDGYRAPTWAGPPDNVLPGIAPLRLVLARTNHVVVSVLGALVYPTGFSFELRMQSDDHSSLDASVFWPGAYDQPDSGTSIRFGIQFADGRTATNSRPYFPLPGDEQPDSPVLCPEITGTLGPVWYQRYWVWPLPPPGPLTFAVGWPAKGVGERRIEMRASILLDAAKQAEVLWE